MFGLSFGEMVLVLVVGIVVVGPRQLPTLMRTAGQWVAKLRRMSSELRSQSGIDELIRQEGLEKEIAELRALSRVNVIDTLVTTATAAPRPKPAPRAEPKPGPAALVGTEPLREREYPLLGCDHYDVLADDVAPYIEPRVEESSAPAPAAEPPRPQASGPAKASGGAPS